MDKLKAYSVYRLIDTEDGFDTHRMEFYQTFQTEQEALDYIAKQHQPGYMKFFTIVPIYQV